MNRRTIQTAQNHEIYDTHQQLQNGDLTDEDDVMYSYRVNTPISEIRCYWQGIASSTVGADLVNIKVMYMRGHEYRDEVVQDRHRDGRPVTIEDLARIDSPNWNNNPDFSLGLAFEYVKNRLVVEPVCICNMEMQ